MPQSPETPGGPVGPADTPEVAPVADSQDAGSVGTGLVDEPVHQPDPDLGADAETDPELDLGGGPEPPAPEPAPPAAVSSPVLPVLPVRTVRPAGAVPTVPSVRRRVGLPPPAETGGFFGASADPAPGTAGAPRPAADWHRLLRTLRPRVSRGQLLAAALCALLGFALVVQVRQTQVQGLSQLRQGDLVRVLSGITDRSQQLYETGLELQRTLDRLESGSGSSREAQQAARERLDVLAILAGTAPARGAGIRLDIDDPRGEVDAAVLIDTVQEMRDAGAEAMQVGNVRIVASTAFVDGNPGVDVDGTLLRPPYRFTVIGDPQTLASAVDIPGGVLAVLRQKGATGKVSTSTVLDVDALRTLAPAQYARPAVDATP